MKIMLSIKKVPEHMIYEQSAYCRVLAQTKHRTLRQNNPRPTRRTYWSCFIFFTVAAMTLTTQDLAIQEKILLAVHKWCTIEEARNKDLFFWSMIEWRKNWYTTVCSEIISIRHDHIYVYIRPYNRRDYMPIRIKKSAIEVIVWFPPTIDRVLYALWDEFWFRDGKIIKKRDRSPVWDRKLLNDDWSSLSLRDQSQETKDKVSELLGVR